MHRPAVIGSLLAAATVALAADAPPAQETAPMPGFQTHAPPPTDEVLFNPGMGLYLQYPPMDPKPDEWFMAVCDIAYYRLDWNDVNPEEGVYRFDEYFGPRFDVWVGQHGKRVAFRVMCQSMHSAGAYVTPKWVFDKGVPGVLHTGLRGQEQTDPVFWDDRYLDVHCAFIRQLGAYLDGRPGLEFVDIGSIGEWGEMHLARWTSRQFEETGFSHTRYVQAYRRVIDTFVAAFPRTRIFLNVGGQDNQSINDYAAIRGVHFRQDGLTPRGASYDCGEWLYKPYARRGVLCNFEFHSGYDEMLKKGWDVQATLDRALAAPISYLNTNLFGGGGYRKAPAEVQAQLAATGRRLGFRFVLARVDCNAEVRVGAARPGRLLLQTTWRNDGVAPCPASYALDWTLSDGAGQAVATERTFPAVPTTAWWPGEEQSVNAMLRVPAGTPPGEARLSVAMVCPESGQTIRLGVAGRTAQGAYPLCPVRLVAGAAADARPLCDESFETGTAGWHAVAGLELGPAAGAGRTGGQALRVSGTCQGVWNYASVRLPCTVAPGSKVRLTAWLRVDRIESGNRAPYLKVAANDRDGKWLENHGTSPYDLAKLGTWQLLEGTAEIPLAAGSLDLAIERGQLEPSMTVDLLLDDVRLDELEAP